MFEGVEVNIRFKIMGFILLVISGPLSADPNVVVGDHVLMPDQANQSITLNVSGVDSVTGFNLRAQIGDGDGPSAEPVFQDINFAGGIWDSYPYTVLGGPIAGAEQYAQASVVFNESGRSVTSNGILVELVIDTTGISDGVYDLNLAGTDIGVDSTFIAVGGVEIPANITNGSMTVQVAPPATLVMQEPKADPNGVFTGDTGIDSVKLLWSEPVIFSGADLTITNEDAGPVAFSVDGSGTQFMDITFTSEDLLYNKYTIVVHDSVVSMTFGTAIDGDGDGLLGGDAVILMEHRLREDSTNDNHVDILDLAALAIRWLWSPL